MIKIIVKLANVNLIEPTDFIVDLTLIPPDTCSKGVGSGIINVSPESSEYSFMWNNGETTQQVYNLEDGQNSIIVTDEFDCEKLIEFNIGNLEKPLANFEIIPKRYLFYKINTTLNFLDKSIDSWSIINKWYWDFGDGNYNTNQNTTLI